MEKINFIKTFIPEGRYRQKYEYGDMVVYHINAKYNKEMNAYECYECTLPKATFDETKVRAAFAQFSAKLDALKLEETKADKIAEITDYDKSPNVNGVYINGILIPWSDGEKSSLNRNTRMSVRNSTEIAKNAGLESTTLWLGDMKIDIDCDKALKLLDALEMYAMSCFNVTAAHKAAVAELKTIKEVETFDVTADYPQQLVMKL